MSCPLVRRRDERLRSNAGKIFGVFGRPVEWTARCSISQPFTGGAGIAPNHGIPSQTRVAGGPRASGGAKRICCCGLKLRSARNGPPGANRASFNAWNLAWRTPSVHFCCRHPGGLRQRGIAAGHGHRIGDHVYAARIGAGHHPDEPLGNPTAPRLAEPLQRGRQQRHPSALAGPVV